MHLWTEYEGRTIADHYKLGRLLRSEGRNGFFATADKDGHPAVIRLTEAHFDEEDQLRRWRQVADVHQGNLIEIDRVGRTTFEGVALTYALMEPDDANLGDVLKERPMTSAETMQVARAVLSALRALHSAGMVHEHVEPANVMAVGETVKLRSDCVRECVADGEFNTAEDCADLRRRDIHGFGTLLLRCLTLESEWTNAHYNLPDPFKRVIPKALDGSWSIEQLGAALDPTLFVPKPATSAAPSPAGATAGQAAPAGSGTASATAPGIAAGAAGAAAGAAPGARSAVPGGVAESPASPARPQSPASTPGGPAHAQAVPPAGAHVPNASSVPAEAPLPTRSNFRPEPAEPTHSPSRGLWIGGAIALLALLLLIWHFVSGSKPAPANVPANQPAPAVSQQEPAPTPSSPAAATPEAARPEAPTPTPAAAADDDRAAAGPSGWYVVAYTYNHQAPADSKVKDLRRVHNSLRPRVFTPTGHAPFFITLGGTMSSERQAEGELKHARRQGMPRDSFVRHF